MVYRHYPITGQQNCSLVQIETNCRRHFKLYLKWKISTRKRRKHGEKGEIAYYKQFLLYLTMFSTAIYLECVKMLYCVVVG